MRNRGRGSCGGADLLVDHALQEPFAALRLRRLCEGWLVDRRIALKPSLTFIQILRSPCPCSSC
jgi:hypothetical protein